jgi:KDO2-lipid IV(A) lauroyltransferase
LGNWDVGVAALSHYVSSVNVIAETLNPPNLNELFTQIREVKGTKVISLGKPMRIYRALKANEIVIMSSDRNIVGKGISVDFFGDRAWLPRGPAAFALRTGAVLVPAFTVGQDDGTYLLRFDEAVYVGTEGRYKDDMQTLTQKIARKLETYIRRYPDQWCMLQPVWKNGG